MSILSTFQPFNFNEGVPSVSITPNGVTFNKSVVLKLGCPSHVRLLIDYDEKRIAVQPCSALTEYAMAFYKEKAAKVLSVRWNGRDLLNTLQSMMDWKLSEKAYRCVGEFIREDNAVIFDLTKANELS